MQSLEHQALAYFRSKPADEEYNFSSTTNCAMCQFLRDTGYPVAGAGGDYWRDTNHEKHDLPSSLTSWDRGGSGVLSSEPWTFGALADRLAAELAK